MGRGLQLPSARVIALGRLLTACLFALAIGIDFSEPAKAPVAAYGLLAAYVGFALTMVLATWRNWWFDAKSAGPAHATDILFFAALVFLTDGYTSPFFVFFMFLLLAAAIRWGWRETTLTAILVALLYLISGYLAVKTGRGQFELYRFLVRSADLVILSLVLIWFGSNKWGARPGSDIERALSQAAPGSAPLATGTRAAMTTLRARRGSAVWKTGSASVSGFTMRDGESVFTEFARPPFARTPDRPLLYDLCKARALSRDSDGNLVDATAAAGELIGKDIRSKFELSEGLAIPVRTGAGEGVLFLEGITDLSTDHIDAGGEIADALAAHIQRQALLEAAEESAAARSRLGLARDLHDSVVQFLAGAAFRLEAMRRGQASGRAIEAELEELKKLMLEEQGELRSFIAALRSGSQVTLRDLVRDLQALADRLSRQWTVRCALSAKDSEVAIPAKLQLDAHQLVREAVANAVRHAGASSIQIAVAARENELHLDLINDGRSYPQNEGRLQMPKSLQERIDQAGGAIELSRGMNVTKLSISLPLVRSGA